MLHLSKCHVAGNHMSRLNYVYAISRVSHGQAHLSIHYAKSTAGLHIYIGPVKQNNLA